MQYDRIVEKAEQLGYDTSKIEGKEAKVQAIASAVGISNFDIAKDCNLLENRLDDEIYEKNRKASNRQFRNVKDKYDEYKEYQNRKNVQNNANNFNNHNKKDYNLNNYHKPEPNSINNLNSTGVAPNSVANTVNSGALGTAETVGATGGATAAGGAAVEGATAAGAVGGAASGAVAAGGTAAAAGGAATVGTAVLTGGASLVVTAAAAKVAVKEAQDKNNNLKGETTLENSESEEKNKKGTILSTIGKILTIVSSLPIIIGIIIIILIFMLFILLFTLFFNLENNYNNNLYTCDGMSINKTTLSKDEFIEKMNAYFINSSHPGAQIFITNAATIYDLSTKNNINPELVVIRAYREGFSPSGNRNTLSGNPNLETYNNYWGLGCNNTGSLSDCNKYDSFSKGLLGFIDNIKNYATVTDMMSRYSSIGKYWYNTEDNSKNTGLGGCYYFEYMKEYMPVDRINAVTSACAPGNYCYKDGSGNCVATTDEDKLAYTRYQVSKMVSDRETIFGIPADECNSYSGQCTIFAQSDSRWGRINLGQSNAHMSDSGCAVTSLAIGIACSGTLVTTTDFNPGVLVDAMNKGNCFTRGGAINSWDCQGIYNIAPNIKYIGMNFVTDKTSTEIINLLNSYDKNNHFILVHYRNADHPRGHFVVYLQAKGDYLEVQDPASGGKINLIPIKDILKIVVYEFAKDGVYEE